MKKYRQEQRTQQMIEMELKSGRGVYFMGCNNTWDKTWNKVRWNGCEIRFPYK